MILQEHHKTYAVKCFAQYMTCDEVATAFMNKFPEDLPKPPTEGNEKLSADEQAKLDKHIDEELNHYKKLYFENDREHGIQKFKKDLPELTERITSEYQEPIDKETEREHKLRVKSKISNQLRRYNIDHIEFPKKYKELFNQTRAEYETHLLNLGDQKGEFFNKELQKMFAVTEKRLIEEKDPNKIIAIIRLKLQLLTVMQKQELSKEKQALS